MANRTVIVDNNTWNNTHIATVGTAMSSPEKAAWEIFNSLDVKYVLVVFGGMLVLFQSLYYYFLAYSHCYYVKSTVIHIYLIRSHRNLVQ